MGLSVTELQTLSRLLDEGLALDTPARARWLAGLPAAQAPLRLQLQRLLDQPADATGPFAQLPALPDADAEAPPATPAAQPGDAVGPYRLLRLLGRGGMGEVWLAERADGAFERQVALKLPRPALAGALAGARDQALAGGLRREVQLVARLEHPHIARLYDTGSDDRGRPWIAMELVDGQPFDQQLRALPLAARLRLFLQVLQAVAYAHGRLVLHLDLKPANVLVSADGVPHLLDFGIATLLAAPDAAPPGPQDPAAPGASAGSTAAGDTSGSAPAADATPPPRALTPRYAAPEQRAGGPLGVQADVHALGVMLQALLADLPPQPELQAVAARARAADPAARYPSVESLAAELQRFLRHEPVQALPGGPLGRAAKALRRHWRGTVAAALVLGVLGAGLTGTLLHQQRMAAAAEREQLVKAFVAELFTLGAPSLGDSDPRVGPPGAAPGDPGASAGPGRRTLDDSAALIEARFAGRPALQAELYGLVGASYAAMGAGSLAVQLLQRQVQALQAGAAPEAARAQALLDLAEAQIDRRQPQQAEALLQQAQALPRASAAQQARAALLGARMAADLGRNEAAAQWLAQHDARLAATGREADDRSDDAAARAEQRAWAAFVRAELALRAGRLPDALPAFDAAAALAQRVAATAGPQPGPPSLVAAAIDIKAARWAVQARRNAEAQQRFDRGVAALRARGGLHSVRAEVETVAFWDLLSGWSGLAPVEARIGEMQRSLARLRALGPALPSLLQAEMEAHIGSVHLNWGDVRGAAALIEPGLALRLQAIRVPLERVSILGQAAGVAMDGGRHELADQRYRARRAARIEAGRGRHFLVANDARWVALNASMAGRTAAALQALDELPAPGEISEAAPEPLWYEDTVAEARARVLLDAGRAEEALAVLPPRAPRLQDASLAGLPTAPDVLRGEALCLGPDPARRAQGLALLQGVAARLDGVPHHPHAPQVARLRAVLGLCALRAGRRDEARALAAQARAAFTAEPAVSPYHQAPWRALEAALRAP